MLRGREDQLIHPMSTKPEATKVYRMVNPRGQSDVYARWDGERWHLAHPEYEHAALEKRWSICAYDGWFTGWYEVPEKSIPVGFRAVA